MGEKCGITYEITRGRIEMHDGIIEGSRVSPFYHPECTINVKGKLSDHVAKGDKLHNMIAYQIMIKLQEMHMSCYALRYDERGKSR